MKFKSTDVDIMVYGSIISFVLCVITFITTAAMVMHAYSNSPDVVNFKRAVTGGGGHEGKISYLFSGVILQAWLILMTIAAFILGKYKLALLSHYFDKANELGYDISMAMARNIYVAVCCFCVAISFVLLIISAYRVYIVYHATFS